MQSANFLPLKNPIYILTINKKEKEKCQQEIKKNIIKYMIMKTMI